MKKFLKLFSRHNWNYTEGDTYRVCKDCGRRERLRQDDWGTIWEVEWEGYANKH